MAVLSAASKASQRALRQPHPSNSNDLMFYNQPRKTRLLLRKPFPSCSSFVKTRRFMSMLHSPETALSALYIQIIFQEQYYGGAVVQPHRRQSVQQFLQDSRPSVSILLLKIPNIRYLNLFQPTFTITSVPLVCWRRRGSKSVTKLNRRYFSSH
jgi:hypothetical protein